MHPECTESPQDVPKNCNEPETPKTYLGNVKVVWTDGNNVDTAPREDRPAAPAPAPQQVEEDLPF